MGHVSARMITRQHTEVKQSEQAHLEAFRESIVLRIRILSAPDPHRMPNHPHQIRIFRHLSIRTKSDNSLGAYSPVLGLTEGSRGLQRDSRGLQSAKWCGWIRTDFGADVDSRGLNQIRMGS